MFTCHIVYRLCLLIQLTLAHFDPPDLTHDFQVLSHGGIKQFFSLVQFGCLLYPPHCVIELSMTVELGLMCLPLP